MKSFQEFERFSIFALFSLFLTLFSTSSQSSISSSSSWFWFLFFLSGSDSLKIGSTSLTRFAANFYKLIYFYEWNGSRRDAAWRMEGTNLNIIWFLEVIFHDVFFLLSFFHPPNQIFIIKKVSNKTCLKVPLLMMLWSRIRRRSKVKVNSFIILLFKFPVRRQYNYLCCCCDWFIECKNSWKFILIIGIEIDQNFFV